MLTLDPERFATVEKARKIIDDLEHQFQQENGKAGFSLSIIYSEGSTFVPQEVGVAIGISDKKAISYAIASFDLLHKEAEAGDAESMHLVANYYQCGTPPVTENLNLFKYWTEKAAEAGFICLENLLAIYGNPKSEFYDDVKARQLRKQLLGNE